MLSKFIKLYKHLLLKFSEILSGQVYITYMNLISIRAIKYCLYEHNYYVKQGIRRHYFIQPRGSRYRNGLKYNGNKVMESYNLNLIKINTNDLVVDVGANNGDLILGLPTCRYIGFEPSPVEFRLLEKNKLPNHQVYNLAVGKENKDSVFYVSSRGADSSLFKPPVVDETIQIKQVRLDLVINESIKLLKIDAEGGELEVLIGALQLLDRITFIAVDAGFEKGLHQETTAPEVLNFLFKHNFELVMLTNRLRFLFVNKSFINYSLMNDNLKA
jgi:FkbM family methyltransferase